MKVDSPTPLTSLACSLIHLWIDGCLNWHNATSSDVRFSAAAGGLADMPPTWPNRRE
jgi:hypothetical protein